MICVDCKLKSICKVFEMSTNMSPSMNILVSNCRMCLANDPISTDPQTVPVVDKPVVRTQEALLSISERIKIATVKSDPVSVTPVVAKPAKSTAKTKKKDADIAIDKLTVKCSGCGEKVFDAVAVKCTACGNVLCDNCITNDMNTDLPYCEECWDKQPPAKL